MNGKIETPGLHRSLNRMSGKIRSLRLRQGFDAVLLFLLLGAGLLAIVDLEYQLAPPGLFLLGRGLVFLGFLFLSIGFWRAFRLPNRKTLAVMAEEDSGHRENLLISAIQFEEAFEENALPRGISRSLMWEEIRRANEAAETLRASARRERRILARIRTSLGIAVLLAGTVGFVWPGPLGTVAIRYLDPNGDHPPWCGTFFRIDPLQATVAYGDNHEIRVVTEGKAVRNPYLQYRTTEETWNRLPLFTRGDNLYSQTIAGVTQDLVFRIRAERGWSRMGGIAVDLDPRIGTVEITRHFPAYTRLGSRKNPLGDQPIAGVYGTKVELEIRSNRPLSRGMLEIRSPDSEQRLEIPLERTEEFMVSGAFEIVVSASFEIRVWDVDGRNSRNPRTGSIEAIPDEPPLASIEQPSPVSLSTPDFEVPVIARARDDFGIRRIEMIPWVNGKIREATWIEYGETETYDFVEAEFTLKPSSLGAAPGDLIEFQVRATDNNPGGERTGASEIHRMHVISDEDYARMLAEHETMEDLRRRYAESIEKLRSLLQAQKRLREEVEALEKELQDPTLSEEETRELMARLEESARDQAALAETATELAREMAANTDRAPVFPIERQFQELMRDHAKSLEEIAAQAMTAAAEQLSATEQPSSQSASNAPTLALPHQRKAEQELERMVGEQKQQIEATIEQMEKMMEVYGQIVRLYHLWQDQKEILQEAGKTRFTEQPTREQVSGMRELARNQNVIRGELLEIQEILYAAASEMVGDPTLEQVRQQTDQLASALDAVFLIPNTELGTLHLSRSRGEDAFDRTRDAETGFELLFEGKSGNCEGAGQCNNLSLAIGMASGEGPMPMPGQSGSMGMSSGTGTGTGYTGSGMQGMMGSTMQQIAHNMLQNAQGSPGPGMDTYGPQTPGGQTETTRVSRLPSRADQTSWDASSPLAHGAHEVMRTGERTRVRYLPPPRDSYPEEYRRLVDDYFRTIAEEER